MASSRSASAPTTAATAEFYDQLATGERRRGWWGADRRFDADKTAESASVRRFFTEEVARFVGPESSVLDLGCGTGGFLAALSPLAGEVVGLDVSLEFVAATRATIERRGLDNAVVEHGSGEAVPFDSGRFDVVVLVDVIHHLERIEPVLAEVHRVLAPGGRLLVFEPNKLNPLLFAMCAVDRNEWGLLRLGSKRTYRSLLEPAFRIDTIDYNGILIGPDGPRFMRIAEWLAAGRGNRRLGWLSPKLFVAATRA